MNAILRGPDANFKAFLTAKKKKKRMKIVETETELRQMFKLSQIKRYQIKKTHFIAITSKNIKMSKQNCSIPNHLGKV